MDLNRLERPVFLVDEAKSRRNIARMAERAAASGIAFRPHVKTHQSSAVAGWYRDYGVDRIAASSVDMAAYFQAAGWTDILVAVPVNVHQIPRLDALAGTCTLRVLVDSQVTAAALAESVRNPLGVWIEMDTGYHRTGLPVGRPDLAVDAARIAGRNPRLRVEGLLAHDGHTYGVRGRAAVLEIFERSLGALSRALARLSEAGFPGLALSVGDTPTCSLVDVFPSPVSEIRPGNFIFYDLTQADIGACGTADIAAAVACPVLSTSPARNEAVLYGGGVHISKESVRGPDGAPVYGRVARLRPDQGGWTEIVPGAAVVSLSQEQGIVRGPGEFMDALAIGDTLVVLPVHACLTANLHGELFVLGRGAVPKFRL